MRINNIARYLKSKGHELVLVSFVEKNKDMASAERLYDNIYTVRRKNIDSILYSFAYMLCGKPMQCGYYHSQSFRKLFQRVVQKEKPDLYIAHLLRMVPYLMAQGVQAHSIVEMTDALSKTYSLSSKAEGISLKKFVYGIERRLICKYEKRVARLFPKVVLVSKSDIDYLRQSMGTEASSLTLHTNGVEMFDAASSYYDADKICFIGNMRTLQNQDAVLHFVNDILPLIKSKRPNVKFYVVGAEPPKSIIELSEKDRDVVVTGFVDNLSDAVSDSCVAVAPVHVAAGIQNKVLVAMSMGIPVVMSSLISKAIPQLKNGENCFIENDNESFAESCLSLMEDASLHEKLSRSGYTMVKEHYSWSEKLRGYDELSSEDSAPRKS